MRSDFMCNISQYVNTGDVKSLFYHVSFLLPFHCFNTLSSFSSVVIDLLAPIFFCSRLEEVNFIIESGTSESILKLLVAYIYQLMLGSEFSVIM